MTDSIGGGLWLGRYQALMSGSFVEFSLVVCNLLPHHHLEPGCLLANIKFKYQGGSNVHH